MEKLTLKQKITAAIMGVCMIAVTGCGECIGTGFILLGVCAVAGWIGGWFKEPENAR